MVFTVTSSNCQVKIARFYEFFRLQNSSYFCVVKYARAVKQKVWNDAESRERDWGETLKIEDKSASENAKALKHVFKSKMKSMKEEKWKNKALHGQYPKILESPHVDTVITNKWL